MLAETASDNIPSGLRHALAHRLLQLADDTNRAGLQADAVILTAVATMMLHNGNDVTIQ